MLDFKENIGVLLTKLQGDLRAKKNCEGTGNFIETVTELTSNFNDYFYCASRRFNSQNLISIQAEIELSEKNLRDFEDLSRNLFNVIFTLRALGIEIEKMKLSLELLYKQVEEFWTTVKLIQNQNLKLIKILSEVWKVMTNLKKHLYLLNQHQKDFIENNLELGIVSFADYINCSNNPELNSILKSLGQSSMYFSETVRQMKYLNYLLFNHQKLKNVHIMFSFHLMILINKPELETSLKPDDNKFPKNILTKCFKKKKKQEPPIDHMSDAILHGLEKQSLDIGSIIHSTSKEVKEVHCASIRREEIVLADIEAKRMVLLRGLNQLQNIIAAFTQMENANDALIGKTVKIRPLYKNIKPFLNLNTSDIRNIINDITISESNQQSSNI